MLQHHLLTTCSPSWLSVSPLIPLKEFGDDAYERTPLLGIAGDYRATTCFASLSDCPRQPRSEGVRATGPRDRPLASDLGTEVDPDVHAALTPETRLYALACRPIYASAL